LLDAGSSAVRRVIAPQCNPDTLSRTLQMQAVGTDSGNRSERLRIKAPPVELIDVNAEINPQRSV
jgi:hypothetical protein